MNFYYILFGIIFLSRTKCSVVDIQKGSEVVPENSDNKFDVTKRIKNEVQSVYLEDVVYALTHQNWTTDELPCLNQTLLMLRNLQNFTLWAVWQWDAISSQPEGILYGNRYELGNFDECMDPPWADQHEELRTQYCLTNIVLERSDQPIKKRFPVHQPVQPYQSTLDFMERRPPFMRALNELVWGACVPASCGPRAVRRLMATLLARSHLGVAGMRPRISVEEPCQRADQPRRYDGLFYAFVTLSATLTAAALICTYLNRNRTKNDETTSVKADIINAFCLRENASALLKVSEGGIKMLYGVRFLTICLIVLGHQMGLQNGGPISDGTYVDKWTFSSALAIFILHMDVFVDSFFWMSGFFLANALLTSNKLPSNPLIWILKRYVRLVVAFAMVIFYIAAVLPYTGTGPLWNRAVASDTAPCRRNWWINLLMLNNYVRSDDICIIISWYIPCDFHFFVVTILVFWLYKRLPALGCACAALLAVASIALPAIITYVTNIFPVQLLTYDFVKDPRASDQFHLTYIKSHTRFSSYIVGLLTGYIYSKYCENSLRTISQKWSLLGMFASAAVMALSMYLSQTFLWRDYHPLEGAAFAALARPAWSACVGAITLLCALGGLPFVTRFLSWYPWVPLSRLSYGLYLTHTLLQSRNVMIARNPIHNDFLIIMMSTFGGIVIGCVCALMLWLLAEAPANNLLVLLLKPRRKPREDSSDKSRENPGASTDTLASERTHNLHSNLPSTVELYSKV